MLSFSSELVRAPYEYDTFLTMTSYYFVDSKLIRHVCLSYKSNGPYSLLFVNNMFAYTFIVNKAF